jgi:hypothetical protein
MLFDAHHHKLNNICLEQKNTLHSRKSANGAYIFNEYKVICVNMYFPYIVAPNSLWNQPEMIRPI